MSGRDHVTDVNGDCMPDCDECEKARLHAEIERLRAVISLKDDRIRLLENKRRYHWPSLVRETVD
jgi:hypothetical protein